MTIFIITAGSYSNYSIHSVCSTKENAERVIEAAKDAREYWASEAEIEEWRVDEAMTFSAQRYWTCGMLLETGAVVEPQGPHEEPNGTDFCMPFRGRIDQYAVAVPCYGNKPIVRVSSTVSFEHALKIAAEKRQQWLRDGKPIANQNDSEYVD